MGKLIDMTNKLKQLSPQRMTEEVLVIVQKNEQVATNMVTDQMFQGQDAKGNEFPEYSDRSVTVFGKRPGPWTGYSTGDLYSHVFMNAKKFPVVFGSSSLHAALFANSLVSKDQEPDDTYGLQKQNLADFSKSYVLPDLQKFLRDFLHV
jgi:hypothetical protein